MNDFVKIVLLPGKERSLKLFHPWVFSGAIAKVEGSPAEGEIVNVVAHDGSYLGTGHFHDGSIKVRIFSFSRTDAGEEFWQEKLRKAYACRKAIGLIDGRETTAYRLVHGEGDGLPGVIIDIYGKCAVIQIHSSGMYAIRQHLLSGLQVLYGSELDSVYDKSSDSMQRQQGVEIQNGFLLGSTSETVIREHGNSFLVNWVEGQKTGFFLDQRDNRLLLKKYSSGANVLNAFSYSGGFSMYALQGSARQVISVDSSKKAMAMAQENARLNAAEERHQFILSDAFDYLKKVSDPFDVVILDPPAFAKHLSASAKAMIGYRNLNIDGLRAVKPGGLLFTFSCSQVIDKTLFRKVVFQAAAQAKRQVRILYQLSQGPDHPVNIYHPEGEYLKGLVLYVE